MSSRTLSKRKQLYLARMIMQDSTSFSAIAKQLRMSRNTVKAYAKKYLEYASVYPSAVFDKFTVHSIGDTSLPLSARRQQLIAYLANHSLSYPSTILNSWDSYISQNADGYQYSQFCQLYRNWLKANKTSPPKPHNVESIPAADLLQLKSWRSSANKREWTRAVILLESYKGKSSREIAEKVDRCVDHVRYIINCYKKDGLTGLVKKPYKVNEIKKTWMLERRDNLIRLIHESPKIHGINRTSWFLCDLSLRYEQLYGVSFSSSSISEYLKKEGYVYRKAKEVLTSPDPDFRVKMENIKSILQNLTSKEKFFSIDEFGPFAVKIKGGRSLVKRGEKKTYPQIQKSKGFTICTAALELSTNQISHFYSIKKDTEEMIKMIDLLLQKYRDDDKLYISWDAASWHASKKLVSYIDNINGEEHRNLNHSPLVELAPLPSSAQFLNVIESVFSGLAKSIIHNSDYSSLDECKAAIDKYFLSRNQHFLLNPKRAGKTIWGEERVPSTFKDSQNCKEPKFRC
ncbi:MAG: IS630 family transposase [Mucilaginibacter sp.]|nr:IS630 family transposase [Mucilaginibacter sp.]